MRLDRQDWAEIARVSRAVAERAITEREGCLELWSKTGRDPRALVRAIRAAVGLFEGRAGWPRFATGLEREVRRLQATRRN